MLFLLLASFGLAAVTFVYFFRVLAKKSPKFPYPPGPPETSWLFGNALELPDVRMGHHVDLKFLEWGKEYGTFYTIRVPIIGRMIIIANPDLVKHVVIKKNFPKSFTYKSYTPLFGERSIVILPDKEWFAMRRAFNPGFSPDFLKNVVAVLGEKLDRYVTCIEQDIDVGAPTNMLTRTQMFTVCTHGLYSL
jgi:cytochrome P450